MRKASLLKSAIAAVTLAAFTQCASAQETLTINSFGGDYEKIHRELVITPFEEMYNVKV
ncbi:MAG: hypothetical protein VYD64_06845 [Pseudomonadota bacterium]|nr:hypothetical protein [Pseudomonadota bacterium]